MFLKFLQNSLNILRMIFAGKDWGVDVELDWDAEVDVEVDVESEADVDVESELDCDEESESEVETEDSDIDEDDENEDDGDILLEEDMLQELELKLQLLEEDDELELLELAASTYSKSIRYLTTPSSFLKFPGARSR